jgi:superfamily II DNA or RNA helicase
MTKKQKVRKVPKYRLRKLSFGEDKKKYFPRPYQRKALNEIMHGFMVNKVDRGQAILPCGAGKTAIALWAIEALQSKSTLMLCPSLFLVNQIYKFFAKNLPKNVRVLCVCSEKDGLEDGIDQWNPKEFIDDLNPTTDPKEIADFIKSPKQGMEKRRGKSGYMSRHQKFIIISTYQSSPRITEAFSYLGKNFQFNLAICDEAHRTAGKIDKQSTDIHFDAKIRCQRRLYMTATPKMSRLYDEDFASMNDSAIYGEELTYMSFNQGIDSGFLSDFQVQICGHKKADGLLGDQDEQNAKIKIAERFIYESGCSHILVFCQSIERAEFFSDNINLEGYEIFHINGNLPNKSDIMKRFEDAPKAIITNARCLTEGVDVPGIDCVIFNDPKQSVVDIVQGIGRALRGGEKVSQIMLPLLQSDNQLVDELVDEKNYKSVMNVISAIMSHDERIVENINQYVFMNNVDALDGVRETILFQNLPQFLQDSLIKLTLDRASSIMPFHLAKEYVASLNIKSLKEWHDYYDENYPKGLPKHIENPKSKTHPWHKDWKGSADFFGYISQRQDWLNFEELCELVRSLGFESMIDYHKWWDGDMPHLPPRPINIPKHPNGVYDDWKSSAHFLGKTEGDFVSIEFAKKFVATLNLQSTEGYKAWWQENALSLDFNLPKNPQIVYLNNGWKGWIDFLSKKAVVYLSYSECQNYLINIGITSSFQFTKWKKGELKGFPVKPKNVPNFPYSTYKKEWQGWNVFLKTESHLREIMSMEEAMKIAQPLNFTSNKQFSQWARGEMPDLPAPPYNFPKSPESVYKRQGCWQNWGHFLGYTNRLQEWLPFSVAVKKVRAMKIKSHKEYKSIELPLGIPKNPDCVYKNEWQGWTYFLGNEKFGSYGKCKIWVKKLNCPSHNYWKRTLDKSNFPSFIPKEPQKVFERLGTWKSWDDFLSLK